MNIKTVCMGGVSQEWEKLLAGASDTFPVRLPNWALVDTRTQPHCREIQDVRVRLIDTSSLFGKSFLSSLYLFP